MKFKQIMNTIWTAIKRFINYATTNKSIPWLVFRCFMMIFVPYAYLFLCGFIDSALLRTGFSGREGFILFTFFSLIIFWIIGFTLVGISIYKYCKKNTTGKSAERQAAKSAEKPAKPERQAAKSAEKPERKVVKLAEKLIKPAEKPAKPEPQAAKPTGKSQNKHPNFRKSK